MRIEIHYRRPPDRVTVFVNELIHKQDDVVVTYMPTTPLPRPMLVNGAIALENGAPAVWFTFPGLDHDIGRFHTRDGTFTGIYANVLTPVEFVSDREWRTTDLFLDVWIDRQGEILLLDEDELDEALHAGWVTETQAAAARDSARRLLTEYTQGTWPPPVVYEWPIERIQGEL